MNTDRRTIAINALTDLGYTVSPDATDNELLHKLQLAEQHLAFEEQALIYKQGNVEFQQVLNRESIEAQPEQSTAIVHVPSTDLATINKLNRDYREVFKRAIYPVIFCLVFLYMVVLPKALKVTASTLRFITSVIVWQVRAQLGHDEAYREVYLHYAG